MSLFWRDASHVLELTEKTGSLHIGGLSDVSTGSTFNGIDKKSNILSEVKIKYVIFFLLLSITTKPFSYALSLV